MTFSASHHPDLDWSQIRETIKLLTVSVAQVEGSMKAGDESVSALADSFTNIVDDMKNIHEILSGWQQSESRDNALQHCEATQHRINSAIVAFQFYDRLQQCLQHVSNNLKGLSVIIDTPHRLYNPAEWHKFQESIRSQYTMESEKVMFDAIHQGKSVDEALAMFQQANQLNDEDEIELF
ncbi:MULTISPECIES: hypothetical protein [Methylomonas]|uniref:Chemotaxis protein n=2 Tax=Methylomonas TaxID=416 RepID=A0A126T881_9GAMM|nr:MULTISPECIES: hypothetical protein [Methylomonas]AMK78299.1 hypothetical protein JT25_017705 [Methylomonas denitrificans]OAI04016.1 hypothetical protein A1342_05640 [Methylomonas methanica]TCV87670.1 hypothetical protein EDE11_102173 [Methylomonas methanica]